MASLVKSQRAAKGREERTDGGPKKAKKNASKSSKSSGGAGAKYAETPSSSPLPSSRSSSNTKVAGRPERSAKKTQKKGPARENPPSSSRPKGPARENPPSASSKESKGLIGFIRKKLADGASGGFMKKYRKK